MKTPKIVTLEQLCLLPIGTLVSHLRIEADRPINFDCQGTLLLEPPARLTMVDTMFAEITALHPGLQIISGRVVPHQDVSTFGRGGKYRFPHRFVVWPS